MITKRLLIEEVQNLEPFTSKIIEKFFNDDLDGDYKEFAKIFNDAIEKSGCQKIEFSDFKFPAGGLSLHDKVVINNEMYQKYSLPTLLYVIFHEIAHQYQYKKYGVKKMYDIYVDDSEIEKAVEWLRNVETVADEYGIRKSREFSQKGFFPSRLLHTQRAYRMVTAHQLKQIINQIRFMVKKETDPIKISELIFNNIIAKMN